MNFVANLRRSSANANRSERRELPHLPLHVSSLTVSVVGAGVIVSSLVEVIDGGPQTIPLLASGVVMLLLGVIGFMYTCMPDRIQVLDVFVTVTAAWVALALAGAVPYVLTGTLPRIDNALFESVSGFTTTGATVIRPIEGTSKGVLFWRAMSQWIGGMGVIVLVVAVLPTVGSGGMDLLQAESPGPTGERLTPRVQETAKRLWLVYCGFTVLMATLYMGFGMSLYDGVYHAFTTVSTGGFSPYNLSLGHFQSAAIEWTTIAAMFAAGCNFIYWYKLIRGDPRPMLRSAEFRTYVTLVLVAAGVVYFSSGQADIAVADGIRNSLFAVITVLSTTGYVTANFGAWEIGAQGILLLLMPLGAMAGSTAGGVKLVRLLAVGSYAHRETLRQLHPRMVRPVRVGTATLDPGVVNRILGFLVLSLAIFGGTAMLILLTGTNIVTATSAAATTFGNVGPGLDVIGPDRDFLAIPRPGRWVGMVAMLLGRLEIYPVLLALSAFPLHPRRLRR